jgi:tRNA (cmo5U34)-methyltransferase
VLRSLKNQEEISKGFDHLAYIYDLMLWITSGNIIFKSQSALIKKLPYCSNVLIIGGGTGKFLYSLGASVNTGHITYIDISQKMIRLSEKYIDKHLPGKKNEISFICGSIESIPPDAQYDLIVTNYFLDVFDKEELEYVFNKLYQHFSLNGIWYYTDFSINNKHVKGFRKTIYKMIVNCLYTFFRFFCGISATLLLEVNQLFEEKKMIAKEEQFFAGGLVKTAFYVRQDSFYKREN